MGRPKGSKNKTVKEYCKRGHKRTPENLSINGDCKECHKFRISTPEGKEAKIKSDKKYYKKNKEAIRAQHLKYETANPEKVKLQRKKYMATEAAKVLARKRSLKYYYSHLEEARVATQKWNNKNRKRINAVARAYARAHRAEYRAHCIARRTRKTKAGGSFTAAEWKALCAKYKHRCLACGKRRKLTADHVIPISKGGSSNIENIQPLCGPCNSSKGAKTMDYRGKQDSANGN